MDKPIYNIEEQYKEMSNWQKVRFIIGCLCFIGIVPMALVYFGFSFSESSIPIRSNLTEQDLWIAGSILGTIGGPLVTGKKYVLAAISGLISGVSITYTCLLYFGWREELLKVEFIVPLLAGFTGVILYQIVRKKEPSK